jgi:hypothetical protein
MVLMDGHQNFWNYQLIWMGLIHNKMIFMISRRNTG